MSTKGERDLRLKIGHVLFIDIVGYSKLLINEQSELLEHLEGDDARIHSCQFVN